MLELLDGKISVIDAALAPQKLAIWTHGQSIRSIAALGMLTCILVNQAFGQTQPSDPANAPTSSAEFTQLPSSAVAGITQHPLEVDISLAEQFVKLGFGPHVLGQRGFESTEFLTPMLSTRQAAQLVQLVPQYGRYFKGPEVAKGIQRFAGRVSSVQFGREMSPVLYVELPYWTHQREGPVTKGVGSRISDQENQLLVQELRNVFVNELLAEEFSADSINKRRIRIWWPH
jgi:hypothetical protein